MSIPTIYKQNQHNHYSYPKIQQFSLQNKPNIHFLTTSNQQFRSKIPPSPLGQPFSTNPSPMLTFNQIYTNISSLNTQFPNQSVYFNPRQNSFPLINNVGYQPPNSQIKVEGNQKTNVLPRQFKSQFIPLKRTQQSTSESTANVNEQPLTIQDFVDFEGQFQKMWRCEQQVEYKILEEDDRQTSQLCKKWC